VNFTIDLLILLFIYYMVQTLEVIIYGNNEESYACQLSTEK